MCWIEPTIRVGKRSILANMSFFKGSHGNGEKKARQGTGRKGGRGGDVSHVEVARDPALGLAHAAEHDGLAVVVPVGALRQKHPSRSSGFRNRGQARKQDSMTAIAEGEEKRR